MGDAKTLKALQIFRFISSTVSKWLFYAYPRYIFKTRELQGYPLLKILFLELA